MTQKHWCVRAAHEREEGVKTHRYAVLKGCRERDIVRRPLLFKLHQSYRPLPCFIPALQEIWSGPVKNSAVMTVMTSTPRLASHYREVVMRLSSQPYVGQMKVSGVSLIWASGILLSGYERGTYFFNKM